MPRKVILDVDPGIDDAVALALALFCPDVEVVAVTATGGSVPPAMATTNTQKVIEQLDPPRWPRIGAAPLDNPLPVNALDLNGPDGLGQSNLPVAGLANLHPAEKVLSDELRLAPEMITVIALGPLTNIAHVLHRESQMAAQVGRLIVCGGSVAVPGNITPCAEFNIFSDPLAARQVIRSPMTKTIVPLDVTQQLLLTFDLLDQLPDDTTKGGAFLRKILPYAFRSYRQFLGQEGIYLHSAVAFVAATHPELFEAEEEVPCDVETEGEITSGATIFDRRNVREWRPNTDVVMNMDVAGVKDVILRGLARVGRADE
jgi:inosine-uridine nucleoside N-ribohydrolase